MLPGGFRFAGALGCEAAQRTSESYFPCPGRGEGAGGGVLAAIVAWKHLAQRVQQHVASDPRYKSSFDAITGLLTLLLPGYQGEGRAYVTLAFGCTGGRHRSVAVAEAAGRFLADAGWLNSVVHRDAAKGQADEADAGVPTEGRS